MALLVVDDSELIREQLKGILVQDGYDSVVGFSCSEALIHWLSTHPDEDGEAADLILLDWVLPDMSGIETVKLIKNRTAWRDIPVIMVTAKHEGSDLQSALDAGASDFLSKPLERVPLLARVRAALRLKMEMDRRKDREKELMEVTRRLEEVIQSLQLISTMDALTGIANRRLFDETLGKEWRRCLRDEAPLSLIMVDLDHFKDYNDFYGHVAGDEALKQVAESVASAIKRPGDLAARYGGEEFCAILPGTPLSGAVVVAENMRRQVLSLGIEHAHSRVCPQVTISCGVASLVPKRELRTGFLVATADEALYEAKRKGRNQVETNSFEA